MRAVCAASDAGALPAGVGFSLRSPGIFDGLAALDLSISEEQGGGSPMSDSDEVRDAGLSISPKYNMAKVEAVILAVASELHPKHLSADRLSLEVVSNSDDGSEVEIATQAIRTLREFGLFKDRDDEIVEPTPAALRVYALLRDLEKSSTTSRGR